MFASECLGEGMGGCEGTGAVGVREGLSGLRKGLSGPRGGLGGGTMSDYLYCMPVRRI